MKRRMIVLIAVCLGIRFCLSASSAQEPPEMDSLWQKAVALAEANQNWVPGLITNTVEAVNKKGESKGIVEETWIRLSLGENGEIAEEFVKVIEKGKDVTEKRKQEAERVEKSENESEVEEEESGEITMSGGSPFNPEVQERITLKRTDRIEEIEGRRCIVYEFTHEIEEGRTLKGTTWLEEETGIPLKRQFSPNPLPKHVKRMQHTVNYAITPEGAWRAKGMQIEVTGGILFIKKRFRITVKFSDWWKEED